MACKCCNEDGSLSNTCYGACAKDAIVKVQSEMERDPLNGFRELILSQVDKMMDDKMLTLNRLPEKEKFNIYKEAFTAGLREGVSLFKNSRNDDDDYY